MISINKILGSLKTDEEQVFLLSVLGFSTQDNPTISKLGGCNKLLMSDLCQQKIEEMATLYPSYARFFTNLRDGLDSFYEQDGHLVKASTLPKLERITKCPLVFMARFDVSLFSKLGLVAIVGSRKADHQALKRTFDLAKSLAEQGVVVVSGGAMGTDASAHEGALRGGGTTIVVSGTVCSFKTYEMHARLRYLGTQNVAILYPYGSYIPQANYMFVERNRFVAALSDHVVIVQGERGSGTLHTARFAKNLGVPLHAFPGDAACSLSYAPNYVITTKAAQPLFDDDEFVRMISKKGNVKVLSPQDPKAEERKDLPKLALLFKQNGRQATVAELIHWSGLSFLQLQKELLTMEMSGVVRKKGALYELTC